MVARAPADISVVRRLKSPPVVQDMLDRADLANLLFVDRDGKGHMPT
jgi:hypothetical protein